MTQQARSTLSDAIDTTGAGGTTGQEVRNIIDSVFIPRFVTYTASTPTLDVDDDGIILLDGTSNTVTLALGDPANAAHRVFCFKAINIDNAVALDPGAFNLEGATTDYTFATVNDVVWVGSDGSAWWILAEMLNA